MLNQETNHHLNNPKIDSKDRYVSEFDQLQSILLEYLNGPGKNVSVYGLAKRCAVSEPTLRRIKDGKTKGLPYTSTIISLLSYIYKEKEFKKIIEKVEEPLASYLIEKCDYVKDVQSVQQSADLGEQLSTPIRYVLYKLAVGENGLTEKKAEEIFGHLGKVEIKNMVKDKLLIKNETIYGVNYKGSVEFFSLPHESFVDNFKTMADFIKVEKHSEADPRYSPMFANFSSSLNKETYTKVLNIQRQAQRKIAKLISDENNAGSIPTFVLTAVDTIDVKTASELLESDESI